MKIWIVSRYDYEESSPQWAFRDRKMAVQLARGLAAKFLIDPADDCGDGDYDTGMHDGMSIGFRVDGVEEVET